MNVAFLLNTPRRRFYNNRKISNLLTGGIDRLIYLSKHYVNHMQKSTLKTRACFQPFQMLVKINFPHYHQLIVRRNRLYGADVLSTIQKMSYF